ncbi:hypothetical protein AAY51_23685, partial [Vibrio parahaemolyticus]
VKDSFGGVIPTLRGLPGAISPLMVGVGALSVATGALFYSWYQGSSTLSDFHKKLVLSGNSAGLRQTECWFWQETDRGPG